MLEVVPEHIHDRSGIFMGSENEVKRVLGVFEKHAALAKAKQNGVNGK